MYEIIVFISMGALLTAYCLFHIVRADKIEKYVKKNAGRFFLYNGLFIVAMLISGLMLISQYEDRLVINAQEISTGYEYHIHQRSEPSFSMVGPWRKANKFILWGETPVQNYKMTEWTVRDDGQTDTYVLENVETKEHRTMRRLYGDDRIYRTGAELLEHNTIKGGE